MSHAMKLTVGLGCLEDYPEYVRAGADEVFCGYVPEYWMEQYDTYLPLNRREVIYYQVQLGSRSELEILKAMEREYQVPVTITLNALYYLPDSYRTVLRVIRECYELGFHRFIIADPALLVYLQKQSEDTTPEETDGFWIRKLELHISGELGENNRYVLAFCEKLQARRMIFHRKNTPEAMGNMIRSSQIPEFEAFAMNEQCHFHGGYCSSLHCDELPHLCLVPWTLEKKGVRVEPVADTAGEETGDIYIPGSSGCGLCAFYRLRENGITYLKIVGRGAFSDEMKCDMIAAKTALRILEESGSESEYIRRMKKQIFPEDCSHNCYYPESESVKS